MGNMKDAIFFTVFLILFLAFTVVAPFLIGMIE
jgi:hypothetical protein